MDGPQKEQDAHKSEEVLQPDLSPRLLAPGVLTDVKRTSEMQRPPSTSARLREFRGMQTPRPTNTYDSILRMC